MTASSGSSAETTVVEVEFEVSDPQYPLVALSAETGCEAELVQLFPRSNEAYTVFHRISGASPDRVIDFTRSYENFDARLVSESNDSAIVEFRIGDDGDFFTISLTDAGAIPTRLTSTDGVARIVAEIPPIYSASEVIDRFRETYPSMEMIARRQKPYSVSLSHWQELQEIVTRLLTPRQHEALLLAYTSGFYDWPREITGEELAAELGVTPATFHEHLRSAEKKLLSVLFTAHG